MFKGRKKKTKKFKRNKLKIKNKMANLIPNPQ